MDEVNNFLTWLDPPNHSLRHQLQAHERPKGTISRLLQHKSYQEWRTTENSIFRLEGESSSENAILCSAVIDALESEHRASQSTAVVYFYFEDNNERFSTEQGLFSSLLAQLCVQLGHFPHELKVFRRMDPKEDLTFGLLFRAFSYVLRKFKSIFIMIHALDECRSPDRLSSYLQSMIRWDLRGLHLFLSSRRDANLSGVFQLSGETFYSTGIDNQNSGDIGRPVLAKSTQEGCMHRKGGETNDHTTLITYKPRRLSRGPSQRSRPRFKHHAASQPLYKSPSVDNGFYDEIFCNYLEQSQPSSNLAQTLLTWVAYSQRPLRISEVSEAVAMTEGDFGDLRKICPEIVQETTIRSGDECYQALSIHHSAKDYIRREFPEWGGDFEIAKSCLQYLCSLNQHDLDASSDLSGQFPLAHYAARFWWHHMQRIEDYNDNLGPLVGMAIDFFHRADNSGLRNWVRFFHPDRPWIQRPDKADQPMPAVATPLYYASRLGLLPLVRRLLALGKDDINADKGDHGTALQAAAYNGHRGIVKLLLDSGADPYKRSGLHGTALQASNFVRHPQITKLLQDRMKDSESGQAKQIVDDMGLPQHIILHRGEKDPYEFREELGEGGGGWVEKVVSLASDTVCVRKTMRPTQRKLCLDEVLMMERLKHIHVIKVLGSYTLGRNTHILMEPVADTDLKQYLTRDDADALHLFRWIGCLANGLSYIHGQHVKHKDIKPSNLLVHSENILYTDFGIAHGFQDVDDLTRGPTRLSERYSAPEVIAQGERSLTTDIFSLGCVYSEMLTAIGGKKVQELQQALGGPKEYHYRGINGDKTVKWLQGLSFSGFSHSRRAKTVVDRTEQMLSLKRPAASALAECLGPQGCSRCRSG